MRNLVFETEIRRRLGGRKNRLKLISTLAMVMFFLLLSGFFFIGILLAWYAKDLPRPDKIRRVEGLSTVVLDRSGETIYDIYENQNRILVSFDDIPQALKQATIAIEDKNFYKHQGLSSQGILRALFNIIFFRSFQGGSTLTQQLVKNALLSQERTITRKLKEAILAIQIERKYSKDEILQMYLNETPYGGTAVGVEAAAKYYFNKHVKDLLRTESIVLAGLPQLPSFYSPFGKDPKAYIGRSIQVARRMREDGYISREQEEDVKKQLGDIQFAQADSELRAPHFIEYVKELLIEKFGRKVVDAGGLRVTTTLNLKLQEKVQKIVKEEVDKIVKLKVSNGAAIVIDPRSGEILAMVGSKDYQASESGGYKFNVATQALRQPGSSIKPISYATALKKHYTASTLLLDVETKYPSGDLVKPEYNPKNYDGKYRGPMQFRFALGNSINTVAVKVCALVGIKDVLRTAFDLGLTTLEPTDENVRRLGLSLTLGGGEVRLIDITSAFGVFAASGLRYEPSAIIKVEDTKGNVIFERKNPTPRRVLPEDVSYIISNILSDNSARKDIFGEKSYLVIPGKTVAVKTGTTDDKRDNWTIGYSPSIVAGVWVGNNDNTPMHPSLASGITGAAPIWNRIMREALLEKPDESFIRPSAIVEMEIDAYAGGLPFGDSPRRKEVFIKGTEPVEPASIYKEIMLSKHDGSKLANSVEIAKGEYETKQYVVFTENDPVSSDGKNRWQEGIAAWLDTQTDSKFHPPTEIYQGQDQVTVTIKEPSDLAQINDTAIRVTAESVSINDIVKLELFVDDLLMKETGSKSLSETISVSSGSHIIKVKATDSKGNSAQQEIRVGINEPYATPAPTPIPTVVFSPTPSPTGIP